MKYFFIAGEASGDMHSAAVVEKIVQLDPDAKVEGWGGDAMQQQGVLIRKHIKELAFMGFVEVLANIVTILKNIILVKKQVIEFNPDVVVLIDYPGFNLRIAKWAKRKGFKVVYYISPTVWAWHESRVKIIRDYVDEMIVILPFEKKFYEGKWKIPVHYVGHPTAEIIREAKKKPSCIAQKDCIALLPGSRVQEIKNMLPIMLEAAKQFPEYPIIIAQAPNLDTDLFLPYKNICSFHLLQHKTYDILNTSKLALVTSGTATLETALFKVPQVVCYIANPISYRIAKKLVKVKYISLVNLILDKPTVKELIQDELTIQNLVEEMKQLLHGPSRMKQLQDYEQLEQILTEGNVARNVAVIIYSMTLQNK